MYKISGKIKRRVVVFLVLALALSGITPGGGTQALANSKYFKKYNITLETDKYRYDNEFSPFLSYTYKYISKASLNGDTLGTIDKADDYSEGRNKEKNVYYSIEKSGNGYDVELSQEKISNTKMTTLVIKTLKRHRKIKFTIKLDHYDDYGNIIRADGTFEKKGSWKLEYDEGSNGFSDDDGGITIPSSVPSTTPASAPSSTPSSAPKTGLSAEEAMKEELSTYGVDLDLSRVFYHDLWSWEYAKPKNNSEQQAFDTIVQELNELCKDPDDTLNNYRWANSRISGEEDRSGQIYKDTKMYYLLRETSLQTPEDMSKQRKIEIICNLYFLDRTVYDPDLYTKKKYEDEDYPYQRILDGTYRGVCGRGAFRVMRLLYCTNLGIIPHVIIDLDANHGWLVIESEDVDGTKFMRGFFVTANTYDMKYDIPLTKGENTTKVRGWYSSYIDDGNPVILKDEYYYVQKWMLNKLDELNISWTEKNKMIYETLRFYYYWGGLIDILNYNGYLRLFKK